MTHGQFWTYYYFILYFYKVLYEYVNNFLYYVRLFAAILYRHSIHVIANNDINIIFDASHDLRKLSS